MSDPKHTSPEILHFNHDQLPLRPVKQAGASAENVNADAADMDLRAPHARTDSANAIRFANTYGDGLRWCEPWRSWLVFDGTRWTLDRERRAEALAKQVAGTVWREAFKLLPDAAAPLSTELVRFARATSSAKGIRNMLALAKSEPGMAILPEAFDTHPWLLNCLNGTIDLQSGKLREHRPDDYLTALAPHVIVSGAEPKCPLFDSFMRTMCANKPERIAYLQRLFGMSLVGKVFDHVLPILTGNGANGKTVLIETMLYVFGDYASKAPADLLLAKRRTSHPTGLADLHGKRLVACVETDEGRRLSEATVKELCGGDTVKGRHMRKDFFAFTPSHTIFLITNHLPMIRGTDDGIWRRPRIVKFDVTIPLDQQDTHYAEKLKAEAGAILAWCVRGCLDWQRDGLSEPDEILTATARYRVEMDVVGQFIEECCSLDSQHSIQAGCLYASYKKWCSHHGYDVLGGRAFGMRMTDKKFERKKNNGWWYRGLTLTHGAMA